MRGYFADYLRAKQIAAGDYDYSSFYSGTLIRVKKTETFSQKNEISFSFYGVFEFLTLRVYLTVLLTSICKNFEETSYLIISFRKVLYLSKRANKKKTTST